VAALRRRCESACSSFALCEPVVSATAGFLMHLSNTQVLVKGQEDSRPDYGWEVFVHYKVSLDGDDRTLFDRCV
jgi:hypothetical protein